jgi:hypothetical protein
MAAKPARFHTFEVSGPTPIITTVREGKQTA